MTNKQKWMWSILFAFLLLLSCWLMCVLSYNFPRFADAMVRMYGGIVPHEQLYKRLIVYFVPATISFRAIISLCELLGIGDD